jgi:hypothetical protein
MVILGNIRNQREWNQKRDSNSPLCPKGDIELSEVSLSDIFSGEKGKWYSEAVIEGIITLSASLQPIIGGPEFPARVVVQGTADRCGLSMKRVVIQFGMSKENPKQPFIVAFGDLKRADEKMD